MLELFTSPGQLYWPLLPCLDVIAFIDYKGLPESTLHFYGFKSIVAPRTITAPDVFSVVLPSTF